MGQKVNPHGFRVGVNKNWNSKWFADKSNFADFLVEDNKVRNYVKKKLYAAGVASVVIERPAADKVKVIIATARPGMVIGRSGDGIDELKKNIRVLDTNTALNSIKSSSESNALQTILDALPDNANADALGASLKNKFIDTTTGVTIQNLTVAQSGSDSESSESTSENAISFTMEVSGPAEKLKELLTKLEASIRVIDLKTVEIQRNEDRLSLVVRGVAYYEPAQTIQLENKVVKP